MHLSDWAEPLSIGPAARVEDARGLRILWLKTELLHPVDKGGKIRTIEMLKRLKCRHQVTYLTLDDGSATASERAQATDYCHELLCVSFRPPKRWSVRFVTHLLRNVFSRLPYALARYRSTAMRSLIDQQIRSGRHDLVVSDFLVSALNLPRRVPLPTLLFQHNVEAMIRRRHADNARSAFTRLYLKEQWRRMAAFERQACRSVDVVVGVSEDDCAVMRRDYGERRFEPIPTGVDTDFFRPSGDHRAAPSSLVFTGSMDWMPNADAVRFFADEIMPGILAQVPEATLTVVGRNPSPALQELARTHAYLTVTGRVLDVRPYIEQAACFIVPIRIGGGTRLKIYEGMAMEKPVVSTSIGAEGLPVRDGEDVLLADTPEAFAESVIRVLRDPELARRIGVQAAANVRSHFGWEQVTERFSQICLSVADSSPPEFSPGFRETAHQTFTNAL